MASAVEALKLGATDYLRKPVDPMRLVTLLQELLRSDDVREAGDEDDLPSRPTVFEGMVGGSARMREVFARIQRVAPTGAPVLIVGESGTGKELVARGLHNRSRRSQGPFVPHPHRAPFPRELVASELFGHEKGAFTGALTSSEGKFEDDIGQEQSSSMKSAPWIFSDANQSLARARDLPLYACRSEQGTRSGRPRRRSHQPRFARPGRSQRFREDLYYRLNVFTIPLPPAARSKSKTLSPSPSVFSPFTPSATAPWPAVSPTERSSAFSVTAGRATFASCAT